MSPKEVRPIDQENRSNTPNTQKQNNPQSSQNGQNPQGNKGSDKKSMQKITEKKTTTNKKNEDTAAKVLGAFLIIAGLAVIGVVILIYILSRLPYRTDSKMAIPTIDDLPKYTNEDTVDVKGEVIPGETVGLYVNDKLQKQTAKADDNGKFEFSDVKLDDEKEYKFETVTLKGFIVKKQSEKSNEEDIIVDRTDPSKKVDLDFDEKSNTDTATIKGKAEDADYIILKKGNKEYEAKVDDDGSFEFEDLPLEEGDNEFEVYAKDEAGNEVKASKSKINIKYEPDDTEGSVNGDGASTSDSSATSGSNALPESAGELDAALEILTTNKIMSVIALLAIAAFTGSSTLVFLKSRKSN
ncbi:hypothetical protein JW887_05035 [Candidatus Dojkabacteria bacterium]|nr:hypothetical protein [Candidatus Dojkabacteria bacterium]